MAVSEATLQRAAELRAQGISLAAVARRLAAEGHKVSHRTLARHRGRLPVPPRPCDSPPPPDATEPPEAAAARVTLADDGDDLGRLVRVRDDLALALEGWAPRLGTEGGAVRAYAALSRLQADVVARLVELRPRPEAERERLEGLGAAARDALLARATAAAGRDEAGELRARVAAQADLLRRLSDEGVA